MSSAQPNIVRRTFDQNLKLHPNAILNRVLAARGVRADEPSDNSLKDLLKPDQLGGLDTAAALLATAIQEQRAILVIGDFDTDGATSTALALTALRAFGHKHADFLIPSRFDMGYGLSPGLVELAQERGAQLLLTVDNGVSSVSGVALAKELGMQVVVTDHHLPSEQLPAADAIVNPNLDGDGFPSKNLAGVGVIFYVMNAVAKQLRDADWFSTQNLPAPKPAEWLDLVALGTVADLVPLDKNNRILVDQGLRRIRAGRARDGINALLEIGKRQRETVVASDMGFAVAPRLNAAGRLDNMQRGVECLLASNPQQAAEIAEELNSLNLMRREIESEMHQTALGIVSELQTELDGNVPPILVLYRETWHQGVCGIIAGRIKDHCHRPALVFANSGDGELVASARSIAGLHIRDLLADIDAQQPGLLIKFGGHAMAAGLTIKEEHLPTLRGLLEQAAAKHFAEFPPTREMLTDGELASEHFDLGVAQLLKYAAPWGQGFEEPSFDGEFVVQSSRVVGERHLKLTLAPASSPDHSIDAIAFGHADKVNLRNCFAVFRLDVNHWRGRDSLQLVINHLEARP